MLYNAGRSIKFSAIITVWRTHAGIAAAQHCGAARAGSSAGQHAQKMHKRSAAIIPPNTNPLTPNIVFG